MTDAPSPRCSSGSERDAIAQALLDRFIERGMVRISGPTFPPGTKIQTLVRSYRDDFYADADAVIAILGVAQAALDTQLVTTLHQVDELYNREGYDAGQLDRLDRELKAIRAALLRPVAQAEKVPTARPVAFRLQRVVDDKISKTEFRLFDDEDEARRAACEIGTDYDGLYLVADRHAAFFAQPDPVQSLPAPAGPTFSQCKQCWQPATCKRYGCRDKAQAAPQPDGPAYAAKEPSIDELGGWIEHSLAYGISSKDGRMSARNLLNQFEIRPKAPVDRGTP